MERERIEQLLNAALDGETAPADDAALREALASDAELEKLRSSVRSQDAALRAAFAARRDAADALAERVSGAIGSLAPVAVAAPRLTGLRRLLPMLLSVAAGFLLAVVLFRPWEKAGDVAGAGMNSPPVAHLVVATGPVNVAPMSKLPSFTCPTGGPIESGADVSTGPKSRCEFSTADGSAVRLDAGTKVKFEQSRAITMEQGELWSNVAKSNQPFAVKSPQATVTSSDGQFDLCCKTDETVLRVTEGCAKLQAGADERTVVAGQEVRIRNGIVADPRAFQDLLLSTRWLHDILAAKGPDNPELQERFQQMFAEIGAAKIGYLYEREIRAMGDSSVLPLVYFLKRSTRDADQARRVVAARLLADLAPPKTIPELIGLLSDENGQVRFYIAQALTRLTGETHGRTPDAWRSDPLPTCEPTHRDWQAWWQENKDRYASGNH